MVAWFADRSDFHKLVILALALHFLAAVLLAGFLTVVWLSGGWRQGAYVDWAGVGALASIVSSSAALLVAAGLYFVFDETRARRTAEASTARASRLSAAPYLRIDVGLWGFSQPGFRLPKAPYFYRPSELGLDNEQQLKDLNSRIGTTAEEALSLRLCVTNLQKRPLAIAAKVELGFNYSWKRGSSGGEDAFGLTIRYLAPGQTFGMELCRVGFEVEELALSVRRVLYDDINGEPWHGAHGAIDLLYYLQANGGGTTAYVTNQRGTIREQEREDGE